MASPAAQARAKVQAKWAGATVARRGRKFIEHEHPTIPGLFAYDTQVGPMHIAGTETEIDTAWVDGHPVDDAPWLKKMVLSDYHAFALPGNDTFDSGQLIKYVHPASGEEIAFEPQQLQWSNDLDQIEAIGDPANISPTITDDIIRWDNAYGPGLDFQWQTQTTRLMKLLIINSLAELGSPPQFIIDGGNPYLKIQMIFQKSSGVEIWVDGVEWDEKANNPQTTGADVEFRLSSDQSVLWYIRNPWAKENQPTDTPPTLTTHYRKTGPNLFVEVRVPWTWLETATYPLLIDATVDDQVDASADDSSENVGTNSITATTIRINTTTRYAAARWDVAIAKDSTVSNATVDHYWDNDTRKTLRCAYLIEDADSAAVYTNGANDISNRTYQTGVNDLIGAMSTTAPAWVSDDHTLVDLSTPVEATLARASWASGNYLACALNEAAGETANFEPNFYDADSAQAPKLHVEYTAGAGDLTISVSESIAVAEVVTLIVSDPQISVSDGVAIAEAITAELLSFIFVADDITTGETVQLELENNIDVSDGITVGDTPTLDIPTLPASVADGITATDAPTVDIPTLPASVAEAISVADTPTVSIAAISDLSATVSDAVAAGEVVTMLLTSFVDVDDGVTVGEAVQLSIESYISVADGITAGEAVQLELESNVDVSDGITVGDTPTVRTEFNIDVTEAVSVGEAVTLNLTSAGVVSITVNDGITIGEATTAAVSDPQALVNDGITVGESVTVAVVSISEISISVSDGITLSEQVALLLPELHTTIVESVTVTDSPAVLLTELFIGTSDAISVSDTPTISIPVPGVSLDITIAETITVTDLAYIGFIIATIDLTLRARSTSLTLDDRDTGLTLKTRQTQLTLKTR